VSVSTACRSRDHSLPSPSAQQGLSITYTFRLSVLIESARYRVESILDRHESVRDLVTNDGLTLIVLDSDVRASRWTSHGTWESVESTSQEVAERRQSHPPVGVPSSSSPGQVVAPAGAHGAAWPAAGARPTLIR
jgi:hypothetical protein